MFGYVVAQTQLGKEACAFFLGVSTACFSAHTHKWHTRFILSRLGSCPCQINSTVWHRLWIISLIQTKSQQTLRFFFGHASCPSYMGTSRGSTSSLIIWLRVVDSFSRRHSKKLFEGAHTPLLHSWCDLLQVWFNPSDRLRKAGMRDG